MGTRVCIAVACLLTAATALPAAAGARAVAHLHLKGDTALGVWEHATATSYSIGVVTVSTSAGQPQLTANLTENRFDRSGGWLSSTSTDVDVTGGFAFAFHRGGIAGAAVDGSVRGTRTFRDFLTGQQTTSAVTVAVHIVWTGVGYVSRGLAHSMIRIGPLLDNLHLNGWSRDAALGGSFDGADVSAGIGVLLRDSIGDVTITKDPQPAAERLVIGGGREALQPTQHVHFHGTYATADWVDYDAARFAFITAERTHTGDRLVLESTKLRLDANYEIVGDTTTRADVTSGFRFDVNRKTLAGATVTATGLPATRCDSNYVTGRLVCHATTVDVAGTWTPELAPIWTNLHLLSKFGGTIDTFHAVGREADGSASATIGGAHFDENMLPEFAVVGHATVSESYH